MAIGIAILSYLLGSIPTGYIFGAITGSGNIGATNVARAVGRGRGVATLVADIAKGFLPVFVAAQLDLSPAALAMAAVAAFLGHLFPLFLKFRGGKGVATALGALLALAPLAALVSIAAFAAVVLAGRIVSLGSIAAALAAPVSLWCFSYPPVDIAVGIFFAAMVIFRHRGNIQRVLGGTEPRLGAH